MHAHICAHVILVSTLVSTRMSEYIHIYMAMHMACRHDYRHVCSDEEKTATEAIELLTVQQSLKLGTRVEHPQRGLGVVEDVIPDDPRDKPYKITFDNGESHQYSLESAAKLRVVESSGSGDEVEKSRKLEAEVSKLKRINSELEGALSHDRMAEGGATFRWPPFCVLAGTSCRPAPVLWAGTSAVGRH